MPIVGTRASMTAHTYFHEAIEYIDKAFGEGYAEAHPELSALLYVPGA